MPTNQHGNKTQFSLLNLMLMGTVVAALAGLYHSRQEIQRLTEVRQDVLAENAKLRAEQGGLTIDDKTKFHAIQISDPRQGVWSYRVYLPPGARYFLAGQANRLPLDGEPPSFGPGEPPNLSTTMTGRSAHGGPIAASGCSSGEFLVSIALSRNDQGEKYFRASMTPTTPNSSGATVGMQIVSEPDKWPAVELASPSDRKTPLSRMITGVPIQNQTVSKTDSGPLVLLELRFMHGNITSSAKSDEGLIVWIDVASGE